MLEEFQVYHKKSTPYHPQVNGTMESFNKILKNALTKVCNVERNDWDVCISTVLWAYKMTWKKLTGQNLFGLVYGIETVMPMEYNVPSLHIANWIELADHETLEE